MTSDTIDILFFYIFIIFKLLLYCYHYIILFFHAVFGINVAFQSQPKSRKLDALEQDKLNRHDPKDRVLFF